MNQQSWQKIKVRLCLSVLWFIEVTPISTYVVYVCVCVCKGVCCVHIMYDLMGIKL